VDQIEVSAQALRHVATAVRVEPPSLDLLACYFLWHRRKIWDKGDTIRTFAEAHGVSPKDLNDEIERQAGDAAWLTEAHDRELQETLE